MHTPKGACDPWGAHDAHSRGAGSRYVLFYAIFGLFYAFLTENIHISEVKKTKMRRKNIVVLAEVYGSLAFSSTVP